MFEYPIWCCKEEIEGTNLRQFTASVNMFVESAEKENILAALSKIEAIKEVYEVAGEYDIVSVISTSCMEEFRDLLHKQILVLKGVKSTVITVILKLHNLPSNSFKDRYITNKKI
jgi:DNA-binding Lrp family transcriptional regulator